MVVEIVCKFPGLETAAIAQRINNAVLSTERYLKPLRDNNAVAFSGAPKTGGNYFTAKQ